MDKSVLSEGKTQEDFIRDEFHFGIDPKDPLTKAHLSDHPTDEWIDVLGNGQLKKKIIKKGEDGTRPTRGDTCTVKITGKLEDGTTVDEYDDLVVQMGDAELVEVL